MSWVSSDRTKRFETDRPTKKDRTSDTGRVKRSYSTSKEICLRYFQPYYFLFRGTHLTNVPRELAVSEESGRRVLDLTCTRCKHLVYTDCPPRTSDNVGTTTKCLHVSVSVPRVPERVRDRPQGRVVVVDPTLRPHNHSPFPPTLTPLDSTSRVFRDDGSINTLGSFPVPPL